MVTVRADAADNLMRTGTVLYCPDCEDERIFVVPDCDGGADCGDYCCTDCGAAVSVVADPAASGHSGSTRAA
jgi:hypothetical protein